MDAEEKCMWTSCRVMTSFLLTDLVLRLSLLVTSRPIDGFRGSFVSLLVWLVITVKGHEEAGLIVGRHAHPMGSPRPLDELFAVPFLRRVVVSVVVSLSVHNDA